MGSKTKKDRKAKEKDGRRYASLFIERLKPRRWIFVPTNKCDEKAANSLCTITNQSYASIEYVFQQAGIFKRSYDAQGSHNKIVAASATLDKVFKTTRARSRWLIVSTTETSYFL